MSISALTRSHEINFWLFLNWNQHLWTYSFLWNQHLTVFEVKLTSLSLRVFVESTFDCFWSEINFFELMCWCEMNISCFWSEINIFELTCWHEISILLFLIRNRLLWSYQHFAVFEVKSISLHLPVDVKSSFYYLLSRKKKTFLQSHTDLTANKHLKRPPGNADFFCIHYISRQNPETKIKDHVFPLNWKQHAKIYSYIS